MSRGAGPATAEAGPNAELTDMIQHITDVMSSSQEEGLNKIKKYGINVRELGAGE